jgi:hypothetical protein
MRWKVAGIVALAGLLTSSTPASAITIVGNFLNLNSGPDDDAAVGGGNIQSIFDAAADQWESAILDDATVSIDYYWEPIPSALAFALGDTLTGTIAVTTMAPWFLDLTPGDDLEYSTPELTQATLNGMTLRYGIGWSGGVGVADAFDLLTVLVHEIGHVLSAGPNIGTECSDGDVDITAPLPFAGVAIPTSNCFHVGLPPGYSGFTPALFPFMEEGERRFISDADLLYVAQNGGWQDVALSGVTAVPEPATLVLVGFGGVSWALRRFRCASVCSRSAPASRARSGR